MRWILLALLLAAPLCAQSVKPLYDPAKGEIGARHPCIANDGKTIVFSLWGDIWRWDESTGRAAQLTRHEAFDDYPVLSPDGKRIAFSSERFGSFDIMLMDIDGGPATRLTWHGSADIVCGFSDDGQSILFTSRRIDRNALWRIALAGGTEELVLDDDLNEGDASVRDGHIAYSLGSVTPYRRNYSGSSSDDLYLLRAGSDIPEVLSRTPANERNVMLLPKGDFLFVREAQRHFDFYLQPGIKEEARKLTSFDDVGAEEPRLSGDGTWLVYQRRHYLYRVQLEALLRGETGTLIRLDIRQDTRGSQVESRTFTEGVSDPHQADSGSLLAFVLRGAIWVCKPDGGEARQITDTGKGDSRPRLSPDGKTIAFMSTRSGNSDLWLMDADGKNMRQFTIDKANDFFHNWSPDGQSLVYCSERSGNRDIWLQRLDGQAVQLTTDKASDDDPSFSPDGKFIAYDSAARGNTDLWVMNADGSSKRFVLGTPDVEQSPVFSRDGRIIYFERYVGGAQKTSLFATTPEGAGEMLVASEASSVSITPDDATLVFEGRNRILTIPAPRNVLSAREIPVIAKMEVDLAQERLALFNEAWERLAARFYDPKMHGVDWPAIKARYEPVVARCRTIEELYYYIWMAQGELSASHMGVFGRKSFTQQSATADLGAKLTPVQLSDGCTGLKVSDLESNGSLEKSWVREGDVIVGVDGKRFDARQNSYAALELFNHGYDFKLWVSADGTPENIREVAVKAEAANVATQRRYASLLSARAKTVSEKSRGRMGYIHLSAMDDANLQNFRNYIARPDVRKLDGLIIDARGNRGGLSYMDILDILVDAPYLQILPRTREEWQQPRLYWDKPVVVMCDERSNSGGECFPWAIKALKRGLVVGEQSPGNVIGTSWEPLSDGSMIGIPTEGYFSMDRKTNLENFGVMPDIRVPLTPENRIKRQDPQLDAAIKALLDQLKAPPKGGSGSR
ncbi:MAG: PD40 domain-containing protein [Planctomycetes bacterium]|nr:PD40 domain-containing protein [Planctomycetota bacterium]